MYTYIYIYMLCWNCHGKRCSIDSNFIVHVVLKAVEIKLFDFGSETGVGRGSISKSVGSEL